MEFTKDGRSYEERMRCPLMDGIGYVTELLNSQERGNVKEHVSPSNELFNKLYHKKLSKTAEEENQKNKKKNARYNKILNETVKNSAPQFYVAPIIMLVDILLNLILTSCHATLFTKLLDFVVYL